MESTAKYPLSYSNIPIDQAKSALQKSIRRGMLWDTIQWTVEMFNPATVEQYKAVQTNLFNRLLVIAVEDVSPTHVEAIIMAWHLIRNKPQARGSVHNTLTDDVIRYVTISTYLCQCKKSRVNDWAVHYYNETDLQSFMNFPEPILIADQLYHALETKDCNKCLWLWSGLSVCKTELTKYKYKSPLFLFWVMVQRLYINNKYVEYISDIALSPGWRFDHKSHLLYTHMIHVICYNLLPTNDQVQTIIGNCKPNTSLQDLVDMALSRQNYVPVPECAIDMHTNKGKFMGRDLQFFIDFGAVLVNEDENWQALSDKYLEKFKKDRDLK